MMMLSGKHRKQRKESKEGDREGEREEEGRGRKNRRMKTRNV